MAVLHCGDKDLAETLNATNPLRNGAPLSIAIYLQLKLRASIWRKMRQWVIYYQRLCITKISLSRCVFEECLLCDSPGGDIRRTENCANGGLGVRSPWWCRHTGPSFMVPLFTTLHLFHQPQFLKGLSQKTSILAFWLPRATGSPPASQHSVSLSQALAWAAMGKQTIVC